jgi:hypothetical protein
VSRLRLSHVNVRLSVHRGRPGPDRRQWVIRPLDLLVLAFDLTRLSVEPGEDGSPARLVKNGPGQAHLVVWFPPQHVTERAYYTTKNPDGTDVEFPVVIPPRDDGLILLEPDASSFDEDPEPPPIDAIVAGWSRLVFRVPDDRLPIDWTLDGLLEAMRTLELSVPANALPPRKPRSPLAELLVQDAVLTQALVPALTVAEAGAAPDASPLEPQAAGAPGMAFARSGGQALRLARSRRKARTIGNALGLTTVTGSITRELAGQPIAGEVVDPKVPPILLRPEPASPGETQSALELPYHLILSPNRFGAWFHEDRPATSEETGHTELWHTRLGVRRQDGTLVDGDDPMRTLRAVWALDAPDPSNLLGVPSHDKDDPWRMSLDAFDRHNVVHLSSNFRLADGDDEDRFYEPSALDVRLLMLTSLGAWLDSRGSWTFRQPTGLSIEEWRHRATLGRDHYVRVVYTGFLFPFGHRASVIKISERQFHPEKEGSPAYVRQRMFLVVREPVKTYRTSGHVYDGPSLERKGEKVDLMVPFEAVRILTLVSPLLDPPEQDDIAGREQGAFWPRVGGMPFKFHVSATDTDGNPADMEMPLIFVGKEEADEGHAGSIIPTDSVLTGEKIQTEYETAVWPGTSTKRATVPLLGQKIAFAESADADDTAFAVQTLTFGAEVPAQPKYDKLGPKKVRFIPVVRKADIDVPSLQRLAGTSSAAGVVYPHTYLVHTFGAEENENAGQVFLEADPAKAKLGVQFSSQGDRSGGLVTPDLELSALSRVTGPVSGDPSLAAAGTFDPGAWFGALDGAKLFGVLSLADILSDVGFDELDKLPQLAGQALNQVEQLVARLERLERLVSADPVPETGALDSLLTQLLDADTGSIPALLEGGSVATVAAQLAAVDSELATLATSLPGSDLPPGPRAVIVQGAAVVQQSIGAVLNEVDLLDRFAAGDVLPQALNARFDWRPRVQAFGPFKPAGDRNLLLSVEAADAQNGVDETFTTTCSLDDFVLDLEVLVLDFERVQLQAVAGKKMDVDVRFRGFEFAGPLAFVETLRELIPFDGFSDPPDVQVTPAGITAGFTVGLPNLSVGVFSLENLSLGAGFDVPFVGKPVSTWFAFCTRENPSRLTVSLFGGGFYLGLTVDAEGLQVFEGAIEFGAACSVDFGVASGSVSAMAGLYFKIEGSDYTLAGYFRLRGEVEALGIVTVSIELYLEMRYESATEKCVGTASLSIEIDVALFSTTIEISCTKKFAGSGADPTLAELLDVQPDATSVHWNAYCEAFA